jgi:VWFA-related protein
MRKIFLAAASVLVICFASAIATRSLAAHRQDKQETVKIKSTEVLVDAVVVDHKNHLVTDLTRQDFEVYEDGVLQDIGSFRLVRGESELPAERAGSEKPGQTRNAVTNGQEAGNTGPAQELPNTIIALLDYSTTQLQHSKLVQDAATKYVEKRMQPGDLMAVFVLGTGLHVASGFTSDRSKLLAALKKADIIGTANASERTDLSATIAQGDMAQNQISGAPSQGNVDAAIAQNFAAMHVPLRAAMDRLQGLAVLSAIRAIAMGVRQIPGRKTLLLLSEGFVPGPAVELELQAVAGVANRSQLAIYCLEAQGLETRELSGDLIPRDELTTLGQRSGTNDDRAQLGSGLSNKTAHGGETGFDRVRELGVDVREGGLRELAISTGGLLVRNSNDLSTGLDRIDREMRTYYLFSYRPKNEALDGGFRQIRVALKNPSLTVRARSGYYAMPSGYELLSPSEFQLAQVAAKTDAASKLPLFVRAGAFQQGARGFRVPVAIEIPYSAIRFVPVKEKHAAELQVLGIVRDESGRLVQRFGNPMQMTLTDSEYSTLKVGTIYVMEQVELASEGQYTIEIFVKDLLSGQISNRDQTVYLARPPSAMGLSAVVLAHSQQLYKVTDSSDRFLTVRGLRISPSATCLFHNGDDMIFYFDIYNPSHDPVKRKPDVTIGLKFMRDGQPVNAGLPGFEIKDDAEAGAPQITFCRFLHLAGLRPGDYTLVIDAKDALGNQEARREAAFRVVN